MASFSTLRTAISIGSWVFASLVVLASASEESNLRGPAEYYPPVHYYPPVQQYPQYGGYYCPRPTSVCDAMLAAAIYHDDLRSDDPRETDPGGLALPALPDEVKSTKMLELLEATLCPCGASQFGYHDLVHYCASRDSPKPKHYHGYYYPPHEDDTETWCDLSCSDLCAYVTTRTCGTLEKAVTIRNVRSREYLSVTTGQNGLDTIPLSYPYPPPATSLWNFVSFPCVKSAVDTGSFFERSTCFRISNAENARALFAQVGFNSDDRPDGQPAGVGAFLGPYYTDQLWTLKKVGGYGNCGCKKNENCYYIVNARSERRLVDTSSTPVQYVQVYIDDSTSDTTFNVFAWRENQTPITSGDAGMTMINPPARVDFPDFKWCIAI